MKKNRIIYFTLLAASLVGISFYGGAISYGLFGILALVPIISFSYLLTVLVLIKIYQRTESRDLIAESPTAFYYTLQNEGIMAFAGIQIKFFSEFSEITGLNENDEYELLPNTSITNEASLVCKYRGEYQVGLKELIITDFFKLFCVKYNVPGPVSVYVKPKLISLDTLKHIDITAMELRESTDNPVERDSTVHEYTFSESAKLINWKATAKEQTLKVYNLHGISEQKIGILLDTCKYSDEQAKYLPYENKILEATIALIYYLVRQDVPIHLFFLSDGLKEIVINGINEFDEAYNLLSELVFSKENSIPGLLSEFITAGDISKYKMLFTLMHNHSSEYSEFINILSKNSISCMTYLINDTFINNEHFSADSDLYPVVGFAASAKLMEVM